MTRSKLPEKRGGAMSRQKCVRSCFGKELYHHSSFLVQYDCNFMGAALVYRITQCCCT